MVMDRDDFKTFIEAQSTGRYRATDENLAAAKRMAMHGWSMRAKERGISDPEDLSYSCKFSSLFIKILFGGSIAGNHDHQFNVIDGKIIDLSSDSGDVNDIKKNGEDPYAIDHDFLFNEDHIDSMYSCLPRVESWVEKFDFANRSKFFRDSVFTL
jgi:hypothetical protein